jgi:hypothetical protein
MEVRTEQYAAKREAKAREREERCGLSGHVQSAPFEQYEAFFHCGADRERAEAQRLKDEEEKRREKLLNTKVPIGKPTNSAIMKAEKVSVVRMGFSLMHLRLWTLAAVAGLSAGSERPPEGAGGRAPNACPDAQEGNQRERGFRGAADDCCRGKQGGEPFSADFERCLTK